MCAQRPVSRMQAALPGVGKGSLDTFEARLLAVKTAPHRLNYPLWASFSTDMVAANATVPPRGTPGPRLTARRSASPPAERQ